MTLAELRQQIEDGKTLAAARVDKELGAGTFARIAAYSASDASRRGLEAICRATKK